MATSRRMLFGGDLSPQVGEVVNPITPTGARVALSPGAYQAFPVLIEDADGNLRLMYRYSSGHNSPTSAINERISTDGGLTWPSSSSVIQTAGAPNDLRDPSLVMTPTDRLVLAHHTVVPYNSNNIDAWVNYSDDGTTWNVGSTYALPSSFAGPISSAVSSPPVLDGTDIILPGYAEDGGPAFAFYWRSTDDGATFGSPVVIADDPTIDFVEPQLRILASGRWLCLMRSESNHHTWRTYSDDDGATWSTPDDVVNMTGRPDFIEYRDGRLLLVGRFDTATDSPPYYAVSLDDGATWSTPAEVDSGETKLHMYASFVKTAAGELTMAYALEASGSASSIFVRFWSDS